MTKACGILNFGDWMGYKMDGFTICSSTQQATLCLIGIANAEAKMGAKFTIGRFLNVGCN